MDLYDTCRSSATTITYPKRGSWIPRLARPCHTPLLPRLCCELLLLCAYCARPACERTYPSGLVPVLVLGPCRLAACQTTPPPRLPLLTCRAAALQHAAYPRWAPVVTLPNLADDFILYRWFCSRFRAVTLRYTPRCAVYAVPDGLMLISGCVQTPAAVFTANARHAAGLIGGGLPI